MGTPNVKYQNWVKQAGHDLLDRTMGAIEYLIYDNCIHPPYLFVLAGAISLNNALLIWLAFDPKQIVRNYLHPKGTRSPGHRRRGKNKGKRRRWNLDWNNWVANSLPGRDDVRNRNYSAGAKVGWIILDELEKALYWVFVIDLLSDVAIDWASLIFEYDKNHFCSIGGASLYGVASTPPVPFGWKWCDFTTTKDKYGYGEYGIGYVQVQHVRAHVVCMATFKNTGGTPGQLIVGLAHGAAPGDWIDGPEEFYLPPGATRDVVFSGETGPGGAASLQYYLDGAHIWPQHGQIAAKATV